MTGDPTALRRPGDVAAAYWTAWRAAGNFTESEARDVVDDAVSSGGAEVIPVFEAMWQQAAEDDERRWVGELLQDYLHSSPHRTPRLVIEAAEASKALRAALALVRVASLPAKARSALDGR